VLGRLHRLPEARVELMARTPVLLASFALPPPFPPAHRLAHRVDEARGPGAAMPSADAPGPVRAYAVGLVTWLWQTARAEPVVAALAMGPGLDGVDQLAEAGFRDIRRSAELAPHLLEARFCRHPRLWPDLVRAAASADDELLGVTRLSFVQLSLVGRRRATPRTDGLSPRREGH
jgi:hypothetical protein